MIPHYDEGDIAMLNLQDELDARTRTKWDRVMKQLSALYEAWAKSHTPWHEEVNELMRAYDEWLD